MVGEQLVIIPDDTTLSPSIIVLCGLGPFSATPIAAAAFRLPAPAPTRPASGMNVADDCSVIFTCAGVSPLFASSTSATTPLTTPVDMLVPLSDA